MRLIKRAFFAILLLTTVFLSFGSLFAKAEGSDSYTYLVLGLDDANKNTDAILIAHYNGEANTVTMLQIPRDTYCNYGRGQNKINGMLAYYCDKEGDEAAFGRVCEEIEEIFAIHLDGYLAITTAAFSELVDAIGGVEINSNTDITLTDEFSENSFLLKKGVNKLDGKQAQIFVRYRKNYLLADITRMDAQKLFISAFIKRMLDGGNILKAAAFVKSHSDQVFVAFKATDIFKIAGKYLGRMPEAQINYLTLPGEATTYQGISYFTPNQKCASNALSKFLGATEFDPSKKLLNKKSDGANNVYFDTNSTYRVYTDNDLSNIEFKTKSD